MPPWLYLWPLNLVAADYLAFGAIFLLMRKRSRGKTRKADRSSVIAIFIQACAFAIAWMIARKPFTPFLPVDWRAQYIVAALIVILALACLIFVPAAVLTLGTPWSLQGRGLKPPHLLPWRPYLI